MAKKAIDPTANVIALVKAEVASLRREAKMREKFAHQLRKAESKRVDANLAAIVATAQRAIDTQVETAKTLAATVIETKSALEASQDAKLAPINANVTQLQNAFNQGLGDRQAVVDRRAGISQYTNVITAFVIAAGVIVSVWLGVRG